MKEQKKKKSKIKDKIKVVDDINATYNFIQNAENNVNQGSYADIHMKLKSIKNVFWRNRKQIQKSWLKLKRETENAC